MKPTATVLFIAVAAKGSHARTRLTPNCDSLARCASAIAFGQRMPASNHNWLCLECRTVTRQPKPSKRVPKCIRCGDDMYCLGYKVEVPNKNDIRGWRRLRENCRERELRATDARHIERVRQQHDAERRIVRLAALPENKERAKLIAELKKKTPNKRPEPMSVPRTATPLY